MSKWIQDFTWNGVNYSIPCREVHLPHTQEHNALNGAPVFKTRLEIPSSVVNIAISRLLGKPERWPHITPFHNVVCVSATLTGDAGRYVTDGDGQLLYYANNYLVDVVYTARPGQYVLDYNGQEVYWEDSTEPRLESLPMSSKGLIWGKAADETVPIKHIELLPDEVPSKFEPGVTLIHSIEGWHMPSTDIGLYVGTTNLDPYYSYNLDKVFPAKTLMLRNYNELQAYSFRSYRYPEIPSPGISDDPTHTGTADGRPRDPSGRPTSILRLFYEYRPNTWEKFWRNDVDGDSTGYYYIKRNASPYSTVKPFPGYPHDIFLGKTNIIS